MAKKYYGYKVNCSDIADLMSAEHGNTPVSEKDFETFLKVTQKDLIDITPLQRKLIYDVVFKTANYDSGSVSQTIRKRLYEHYAYSRFGAGKVSLTGDKPIQFEKGEVAEPSAVALLSKMDGVQYEKNEKLYSNKFFKGIPDILVW